MNSSFQTVSDAGEFELVEKRSRFIGIALPVADEEDAKSQHSQLKKRFHDARHLCFAYRLRSGEERYSDDGEPSKTGGFPALQLMQGSELVNVAVYVVRYYGGVKLGTGGLARAYRDAARGAIDAAGIVTIHPETEVQLTVAYSDWDKFQYLIDRRDEVVGYETQFDSAVQLTVRVLADRVSEFDEFLSEWPTVVR